MPLLMIAGGLVAMTSFFLITGLPDKGAGEYKKILNEWNVKDLSSIPAKIAEISSELEKQRRQEDAIVSKSKMLLSYSNIFSLVFWISLLSLAGLVNIDVNTIFDVDTVDAIETTKWIMLGILVASIGLALWLRSKSKAVLRENAADRANGVPAKANGTAGKSGGASGKAAK
jgi:hypothetical protein